MRCLSNRRRAKPKPFSWLSMTFLIGWSLRCYPFRPLSDIPSFRDCSAGASAGEYTIDNAGESRYEAYIKAIYSEIERVPQVQVIIVLEPDSIGNSASYCLATNGLFF